MLKRELRAHDRAVRAYMASGLTRAEAEQMAGRDWSLDINPLRRRVQTHGGGGRRRVRSNPARLQISKVVQTSAHAAAAGRRA